MGGAVFEVNVITEAANHQRKYQSGRKKLYNEATSSFCDGHDDGTGLQSGIMLPTCSWSSMRRRQMRPCVPRGVGRLPRRLPIEGMRSYDIDTMWWKIAPVWGNLHQTYIPPYARCIGCFGDLFQKCFPC